MGVFISATNSKYEFDMGYDDFIQNNSLYIKDKYNALLKMEDYYLIRKDIIK